MTTQLRKKRVFASVEGLGMRLGLLEGLVKALAPDAEISSIEGLRTLANSLGIPLPQAASSPGSPDPEENEAEESRPRQAEILGLRDQQGQTQYIGPASSYMLQIRIRSLLAGGQPQDQSQFFLFGSNPTERAWVGEVTDLGREMSTGRSPHTTTSVPSPAAIEAAAAQDETSPASTIQDVVDGPLPDTLVAAYFHHVHPDFPVLHEASFREEYARCCQNPDLLTTEADPTWICSLLCVLILGRRRAPAGALEAAQGQAAEDRWWRKIQALLPSVVFASSLSAVQALLLAALHLNNNNHKDSSWTLTGTAVRIAIAIGLHREPQVHLHGPLVRELRKRTWWSLYQFELMQAASLDRPSAIDDAACSAGTPRYTVLDSDSSDDTAYSYSTRLLGLLSRACRVVRSINSSSDAGELPFAGPLSPAAALVRDLRRWKETLPRNLSLEGTSGQNPSAQRAVLLLHVQYYHVLCVLTRNAMLSLAGRLFSPDSQEGNPTTGQGEVTTLSDVCAEAAQESVRLVFELDRIGGFDPVTWWDFYFLYAAALVLVLNVLCEAKQKAIRPGYQSRWLDASRDLLGACAQFSAKVLAVPLLPGTNRRYAVVIGDLNNMSRNFVTNLGAEQEAKRPGQASDPTPPETLLDNIRPGNMVVVPPAPEPQPSGCQHGLYMSQGPSGIQFSPDLTNFGFPDASWGWREGQWGDIAAMFLGNEFGGAGQGC